jgi:hypothetical protein
VQVSWASDAPGTLTDTTAVPTTTGDATAFTSTQGGGGGGSTTAQQQCWAIMDSTLCVGRCAWNDQFFFCDDTPVTTTGGSTTTAGGGGGGGPTTTQLQCWSIMDSAQCVGQCAWNTDFSFCDNAPVTGSTTRATVPTTSGNGGGVTTTAVQCWSIMDSTQCVGQCAWNANFFFCDNAASTTPGGTGGTSATPQVTKSIILSLFLRQSHLVCLPSICLFTFYLFTPCLSISPCLFTFYLFAPCLSISPCLFTFYLFTPCLSTSSLLISVGLLSIS